MLAKLKRYAVWAVAAIAAVFAVLLGLRRREDARIREDLARRQEAASGVVDTLRRAKDGLADSRQIVKDEEAKLADREQRAEELAERLRNLAHILVPVAVLVLLAAGPGLAADKTIPAVPSDYDTLVKYYLEAVDVAAQYQQLYEEAEASNKALLAETKALQDRIDELMASLEKLKRLVDEQQATIMRLLTRKPLGVVAGVTLTGLAPPMPGLLVGVTVGF